MEVPATICKQLEVSFLFLGVVPLF